MGTADIDIQYALTALIGRYLKELSHPDLCMPNHWNTFDLLENHPIWEWPWLSPGSKHKYSVRTHLKNLATEGIELAGLMAGGKNIPTALSSLPSNVYQTVRNNTPCNTVRLFTDTDDAACSLQRRSLQIAAFWHLHACANVLVHIFTNFVHNLFPKPILVIEGFTGRLSEFYTTTLMYPPPSNLSKDEVTIDRFPTRNNCEWRLMKGDTTLAYVFSSAEHPYLITERWFPSDLTKRLRISTMNNQPVAICHELPSPYEILRSSPPSLLAEDYREMLTADIYFSDHFNLIRGIKEIKESIARINSNLELVEENNGWSDWSNRTRAYFTPFYGIDVLVSPSGSSGPRQIGRIKLFLKPDKCSPENLKRLSQIVLSE